MANCAKADALKTSNAAVAARRESVKAVQRFMVFVQRLCWRKFVWHANTTKRKVRKGVRRYNLPNTEPGWNRFE
jgi:hypothetical protein